MTGEHAVDEQLLFDVVHWSTEIYITNTPTSLLKLVDNHPTKILFVHGVVRADGG